MQSFIMYRPYCSSGTQTDIKSKRLRWLKQAHIRYTLHSSITKLVGLTALHVFADMRRVFIYMFLSNNK
jgi:hypothetical protein